MQNVFYLAPVFRVDLNLKEKSSEQSSKLLVTKGLKVHVMSSSYFVSSF